LEVIKLTLISKNTQDLKGASYTLGTIRGVEMIKSQFDYIGVTLLKSSSRSKLIWFSYYIIKGDGVKSNHHPISCVLKLVNVPAR